MCFLGVVCSYVLHAASCAVFDVSYLACAKISYVVLCHTHLGIQCVSMKNQHDILCSINEPCSVTGSRRKLAFVKNDL